LWCEFLTSQLGELLKIVQAGELAGKADSAQRAGKMVATGAAGSPEPQLGLI